MVSEGNGQSIMPDIESRLEVLSFLFTHALLTVAQTAVSK